MSIMRDYGLHPIQGGRWLRICGRYARICGRSVPQYAMRRALVFSEDDLLWAYKLNEANKEMVPDISDLRRALASEETAALLHSAYGAAERLEIQAEEVSYPISEKVKAHVNQQYNDKPFLASVGGMLHDIRDVREYRRTRYYQIYGEYPEE